MSQDDYLNSKYLPDYPSQTLCPTHIGRTLAELNIEPILFIYAAELAQIPLGITEVRRTQLEALILSLLVAIEQGNVRMPLQSELLTKFGISTLQAKELINNPSISCLISNNNDSQRPLMVKGQYVYTNRTLTTEISLANSINYIIKHSNSTTLTINNDQRNKFPLDQSQIEAISLALTNRLTLITGGPGTGKTYLGAIIIANLLEQLLIDTKQVAIAAPTGKAAQRIGNAIKEVWSKLGLNQSISYPEPKTLHRLLLWQPEKLRFYHNKSNPILAKVILVDEASMVGQELMDCLFQAVTCDTHVILLGDVDQIPSIDSGCAFHDMVTTLKLNTKQLSKNYRLQNDSASQSISLLANAVKFGHQDQLLQLLTKATKDSQNWLSDGIELIAEDCPEIFLTHWFEKILLKCDDFQSLINRTYHYAHGWSYSDELAIKKLLTHFNKFRLLCVMKNNNGLRCVNGINTLLHDYMRTQIAHNLDTTFYYGEPVIVTTNNYQQGIFNGDCGIILRVIIQDEAQPALILPDKTSFRAIPLSIIKSQLELSYAITIHKAQGSEYDNVAIMLPQYNHPNLTRELLYTAITRTREAITLYGKPEQVLWATQNTTKRDTGLKLRLISG